MYSPCSATCSANDRRYAASREIRPADSRAAGPRRS
ncbi:hypothetical protein YUWDRAFT_05274 [Streptomyces sp. AmelKG-D3]|nr:hypothetical protein YUWDRAFT_05274 [Streptomyces sp. AmelKG-D3]